MDPLISRHLQELRSVLESLDQRCSQLESSRASAQSQLKVSNEPTRSRPSVSQYNAIPTPDAQNSVEALRMDIILFKVKFSELELLLCSPPPTPASQPGAPEVSFATTTIDSDSVSQPSPSNTSPRPTFDLPGIGLQLPHTSLGAAALATTVEPKTSQEAKSPAASATTRSASTHEADEGESPATSTFAPITNAPEPEASPITPRVNKPDAESPEVESPEAESPEAESPEVESPEAESPEAESPEAESPEAESPEAESPEAESPEAESPEAESPEAESPEAESLEAESPEAESPEAASPATSAIAHDTNTSEPEAFPTTTRANALHAESPEKPLSTEPQSSPSNKGTEADEAHPPLGELVTTRNTSRNSSPMECSSTTLATAAARLMAGRQKLYNEQPDEKFSLDLSQMGAFLPDHLARFAQDKLFRGVVKIQKPLLRWEEVLSRVRAPAQDAAVTSVEWRRDINDLTRTLRLESIAIEDPDWQPPDLSHSNRPTFTDVIIFLERMALRPPSGPVAYYVGPSLATEFDPLLHPGAQLKDLSTLPGVNTPYWHFGARESGTAYHSEDAAWRSYNFVVGPGWKVWIVIDKCDNNKFLEFIGRYWKLGKCKQAVRHLNLFIPPSVLRDEHIGFQVHCLGEGEMFVTQDDEYHCVVNYTNCLALAINHLHPGEPAFPPCLKVCRECGIYPLRHPSFEKVPCALDNSNQTRKRPANATFSDNPKRSKYNTTVNSHQTRSQFSLLGHAMETGPVLEKTGRDIRRIDRHCHIPNHKMDPLPCVDVFRYACALGSRSVVCQFRALVDRHREFTNPQLARQDYHGYFRSIVQAAASANLAQLHMRLCKLELFQSMAPDKTRAGRGVARDTANRLGVPTRTYQRWRAEGKIWSKTHGSCRGLLSLIPFKAEDPHGKSAKEYLEFDETQRNVLHRLLEEDEYMKVICAAALAFQGSIWEGGAHVQFGWEESTTSDFSTCTEATILHQLRQFPFTDVNLWEDGSAWSSDPTAIPVGDKGCDYCDEAPCHCPDPTTRTSLLIRRFGTTLGLEAATTSTSSSTIVYPKGAVIGVVAGVLLPPGTLDAEEPWTFDFKPDMQASAAWQICMSSTGSCLRLLTTSESPTARLVTKRRAGKWVLVAEAIRDVINRDQITVSSLPWRRSS